MTKGIISVRKNSLAVLCVLLLCLTTVNAKSESDAISVRQDRARLTGIVAEEGTGTLLKDAAITVTIGEEVLNLVSDSAGNFKAIIEYDATAVSSISYTIEKSGYKAEADDMEIVREMDLGTIHLVKEGSPILNTSFLSTKQNVHDRVEVFTMSGQRLHAGSVFTVCQLNGIGNQHLLVVYKHKGEVVNIAKIVRD